MDNITLKYTSKDVEKMIDIFAELSEKGVNGIDTAIAELTKYPVKVVETFLDCIRKIEPNSSKASYMGIIGFITLRINLVDMSSND